MPTLAQFLAYVRSLVGVWTDQDGYYGAQCVDLILHVYVKFWQTWAWGNAVDYQHNDLPTGFRRGKHEDIGVQPGDILVWHFGPNDQYGHVGICVEVNPDGTVTSVEQNIDGTPETGGVGRLKTRNLGYCVAVIRPVFAEETPQASIQTQSVQNKKETKNKMKDFIFTIKNDPYWNPGTVYGYNAQTNEIKGFHNQEELKYYQEMYSTLNDGESVKSFSWDAKIAPVYVRLFGYLRPKTGDELAKAIEAIKEYIGKSDKEILAAIAK